MLRLTVLTLILANAAYFAWTQGLLRPWGLGSAEQAEPQRLSQQIRPEALRVIGADEPAAPAGEAGPGGQAVPASEPLPLRPAATGAASQPPAAGP